MDCTNQSERREKSVNRRVAGMIMMPKSYLGYMEWNLSYEWLDFVWNINFDASKPEDEYIKLWLNGKLVVALKVLVNVCNGKHELMLMKSENKMTFNFVKCMAQKKMVNFKMRIF